MRRHRATSPQRSRHRRGSRNTSRKCLNSDVRAPWVVLRFSDVSARARPWVAPGFAGPVLVDAHGRPRYWAQVDSYLLHAKLKPPTAAIHLRAIERLYVFAEQLWRRDSLDAVIARADLARVDDLLHAYFSKLRREAHETGHPADEAWRIACQFATGSCERLLFSGPRRRLVEFRECSTRSASTSTSTTRTALPDRVSGRASSRLAAVVERQRAGLQALRRDKLEVSRGLQALKQGRPMAGEDRVEDETVLVDQPQALERGRQHWAAHEHALRRLLLERSLRTRVPS